MITGLNHITLAVSDLDRSVAFYLNVLGLKGHVIWDKGAYLSAGSLWLCLSVDEPDDKTDYTHIAFTVEPERFHTFCNTLLNNGVESWKENASEGDSLYFLDPDGHKLEIHAGSLQTRMESIRLNPYREQQWL